MNGIMRVAGRFSIPVIEDAAQAIGACCPVTATHGTGTWRKAGSMGIAGCFSFFPSKNLGGIGDGGLVTTSDPDFDKVLRSCRNHGASPKYYHPKVGGNFRLDPIQAVVLSIKLKHLDDWHGQRRANSLAYRAAFAAYNLVDDPVRLPKEMFAGTSGSDEQFHHIYNQFVIRVPRRDALKVHLLEQGIGCEIYYPCCLHQQQCVQQYNDQSFPVAEQAARESLALPIYPDLSGGQIDQVVAAIADFYTST
jgi:dTDP-4-amino-4,6-dideoxygalactose transaminase